MGVAAALVQVSLVRELGISSAAGELTLGLLFAAWLLGGAFGSSCLGGRDGAAAAARYLLAAAPLALAGLALVRALPSLAGVSPGIPPGPAAVLGALAAGVAVPAAALAAAFAALCRAVPGQPQHVYAAESIGFLLGGAAYPCLLERSIDVTGSIGLAAIVLGAATFALGRRLPGAVLMLAAALVAAAPPGRVLDRRLLDLQWPGARCSLAVSTAASTAHVVEKGLARAVFVDGRFAHATGETAGPEVAAHLPLLLHPNPRRVFLAGLALDGTLRELLRQPVDGVAVAEPDPERTNRLLPAFHDEASVVRDPRVELLPVDARAALERPGPLFDVLIVTPPPPATAAAGRLVSQQFFGAAARRLAPGGLCCVRLPLAEGFLDDTSRRLGGTLVATFLSVFPTATALDADGLLLVASADGRPVAVQAAVVLDRLRMRRLELRYLVPDKLEELLEPGRLSGRLLWLAPSAGTRSMNERELLARWAGAAGSAVEQDLAFASFRLGLASAVAVWSPAGAGGLRAAERIGWVPFAAVWILLALAWDTVARSRGPRPLRVWAPALATTGAAGMAAMLLLMAAHEVLLGRLLGDLGVLSGLAMAGAAAGSLAPAGRRASARSTALAAGLALALLLAGLPSLLSLTGGPSRLPGPLAEACVLVALLAMGGLTGLQFRAVCERTGTDSAGSCYALDLAGAAVGGLLALTLWLPAWGFAGAFRFLAAIELGSAIAARGQ